eukprot:6194937-Pleurochrysis_carterae.AAC.1
MATARIRESGDHRGSGKCVGGRSEKRSMVSNRTGAEENEGGGVGEGNEESRESGSARAKAE